MMFLLIFKYIFKTEGKEFITDKVDIIGVYSSMDIAKQAIEKELINQNENDDTTGVFKKPVIIPVVLNAKIEEI